MEWIKVKEKLPKDNEAVNITWVNRKPVSYYADIKDKPFTATGVYYKGNCGIGGRLQFRTILTNMIYLNPKR
jgi:hypothetical protein